MSGETVGYDSTEPADLPKDGDWVAGYSDGIYANLAKLRALFPNIPNVGISAVGRVPTDVIDVEPGCVWPVLSAVLRVREWRAQGYEPVVYVGLSNFGALYDAFNDMGDPQPDYWSAHYTEPHICQYPVCSVGGRSFRVPKQPICTQWGGDVPGHYDINRATTIPGHPNESPSGGGSVPIGDDMTDAQYTQLRNDVGYARDQILPVVEGIAAMLNSLAFNSQEQQLFRMYVLTDENVPAEMKGWTSLARPGVFWHVPSGEVIQLIQKYRLAGACINVPSWDEFKAIEQMYSLTEDQDSSDKIIAALNALTLPSAPAQPLTAQQIVDTLKDGLK